MTERLRLDLPRLITALPDMSNRQIAAVAGVGKSTVHDARVRIRTPDEPDAEPARVIGADGKSYPGRAVGTTTAEAEDLVTFDPPDEPCDLCCQLGEAISRDAAARHEVARLGALVDLHHELGDRRSLRKEERMNPFHRKSTPPPTTKEHAMSPITTDTYPRLSMNPDAPKPEPTAPEPGTPEIIPWVKTNDPVHIGEILHYVPAATTDCEAVWCVLCKTPDRLGPQHDRQVAHPDILVRELGATMTSRARIAHWSESSEPGTMHTRDGGVPKGTWHRISSCPWGR